MDNKTFAEKLTELIEEKGVSTRQVCRETGIDIASMSNYKNGKTQPLAGKIRILESYFKTPAGYLL